MTRTQTKAEKRWREALLRVARARRSNLYFLKPGNRQSCEHGNKTQCTLCAVLADSIRHEMAEAEKDYRAEEIGPTPQDAPKLDKLMALLIAVAWHAIPWVLWGPKAAVWAMVAWITPTIIMNTMEKVGDTL